MSYNVYETELHKTYDVRAHKMLSGIEYLTSNDPKNPALGTNNCSVGNINFYEVIAKEKVIVVVPSNNWKLLGDKLLPVMILGSL